MNEFWKWFLDWWPTIAGSVTAVVCSVATFLVYRFKLRTEKAKTAALSQALDDAKLRSTYTNCPYCHHKVRLDECQWKLPGDFADNNLNGVPDDRE